MKQEMGGVKSRPKEWQAYFCNGSQRALTGICGVLVVLTLLCMAMGVTRLNAPAGKYGKCLTQLHY